VILESTKKYKKAETIDPESYYSSELNKKVVLGDGKITQDKIKISTWNINGLKSIVKSEYLQKYIASEKPDILCLNEVKITSDDAHNPEFLSWIPPDYHYYFNCCRFKRGIYGTAILSRFLPIDIRYGFGVEKYDREGRVLVAEYEKFFTMSVYAPNQ
jgi:exodeoxyribonuclease III